MQQPNQASSFRQRWRYGSRRGLWSEEQLTEDNFCAEGSHSMKGQISVTPIATHAVLKMPETQTMLDRSVKEFYDAIARRAFELFERRGYMHGHDFEDWLRAESELFQGIPVEIAEEDDKLIVRAEVPGFKAEELDIRVEPSRLLIRGNSEQATQQKTANTIYSESRSNEIFRLVDLPVQINPEKVTTALQQGILHLNLPKVATSKTTRVEVRAA